jgi:hypothetical protein
MRREDAKGAKGSRRVQAMIVDPAGVPASAGTERRTPPSASRSRERIKLQIPMPDDTTPTLDGQPKWTPRRRPLMPWLIGTLSVAVVALGFLAMRTGSGHNVRGDMPVRYRCQSNLHVIGLAIILYQQAHGGKNPDDFRPLITESKIEALRFTCGDTSDTPAAGPTPQAIAANLLAGGHCSYVYLGKGLTDQAPPNTVLAYDPPNANDSGMQVLLADIRVERLDQNQAAVFMAKAKTPTTSPVRWP